MNRYRCFLKGFAFILLPLILEAQVPRAVPLPPPPTMPISVPAPQVSFQRPPPRNPSLPIPKSQPIRLNQLNNVENNRTGDVADAIEKPDRISEVLDFWFGFLPGPDYFPEQKLPVWFPTTHETDRLMRMQFSQDIFKAEKGEYNEWRDTPRGRLALVLLLDQFPRHLYRNTPQSFILDRMARAVVLEGMQKGDDKELFPIERAFFYLPLEHAEDLQLQNLSVASYRQLLLEAPELIRPQMRDFLHSAITHQQQIARFGRFPHRNEILKRQSTPEETVYLMQWRKR